MLLTAPLALVASAASPCPCSNASLCAPVTREGPENVYAFHTTGTENWRGYDWDIITTVCVFGDIDPELLCHAHANNARVTFGSGGLDVPQWTNDTAVDEWVNASVGKAVASFADGFNIDIEFSASDPADIAALTRLATKAADAMHAANPHSHVTFDVPSEGLVQEGCGLQYGRNYNFTALAEVLDFLVVMDYDSNSPHSAVGHKQHYLPTQGPPYIYDTQSDALEACKAAGYPRLCDKAELEGFSNCADGFCTDFKGYVENAFGARDPPIVRGPLNFFASLRRFWMANTVKGCGQAGYNTAGPGPAGAYCCDDGAAAPCPTCFFANAALPVVQAGVDCFNSLGVPASKLVLAFPWYGYDYTCQSAGTSGNNLNECQVSAAVQVSYPQVQSRMAAPGVSVQWLDNSSTPYLGYTDKTGTLHRVDFDNSRSLQAKYNLARTVGALGVGMWTASGLNYSDPASVAQFWADLRTFRPNGTHQA